ncbi:MAG: hypothetical protein ACHQ1H_06215 [Nitrososphaerales archaeon]
MVAASGAVMYYIVYSLGFETFRPDLVPFEDTALAVIVAGAGVTIAGVVARPFVTRELGVKSASKYFLYGAFINSVAAAVFIAPILYPAFDFPILIAQWPGIYMVIGYTMFLVIGIVGMLAWSMVYHLLPSILSKSAINKKYFLLQFALMEIGIYGLSISMFLGGYAGATILYEGAGPFVVGAQMEIGVIPSGVSIFLLILSTLIGVVSVVTSKKDQTLLAADRNSIASLA